MSKMMDVLDNVSARKNQASSQIQDEIAKTYFHTTAKKDHKKKPMWKTRLPWFVAALAFAAALAMFISRSNIDIKVRVLGEIPSFAAPGAEVRPAEISDKGVFIVIGGEPDKNVVKNVYFTGDAKEFSIAKSEELVLCNARGWGWASYTIELKEPVDLNKLDIKYTAKGTTGNEHLILAIVDSDNNTYRLEKDLSSALGDKWQRYTINFRRVKGAVNLSDISMIKFEFGSLTAGNYPSTVLFLKDICITKTKRFKWL